MESSRLIVTKAFGIYFYIEYKCILDSATWVSDPKLQEKTWTLRVNMTFNAKYTQFVELVFILSIKATYSI